MLVVDPIGVIINPKFNYFKNKKKKKNLNLKKGKNPF